MHKPTTLFIAVAFAGLLLSACDKPTASPPLALPAQQRLLVTLHTAATIPPQRQFIPAATYVERGGLPGVFVLSEGQARFRMVRIGKRRAGQLEVLSGLDGNETLVSGNLGDIHDGTPIVIK